MSILIYFFLAPSLTMIYGQTDEERQANFEIVNVFKKYSQLQRLLETPKTPSNVAKNQKN